jgi:hypothetical protein
MKVKIIAKDDFDGTKHELREDIKEQMSRRTYEHGSKKEEVNFPA